MKLSSYIAITGILIISLSWGLVGVSAATKENMFSAQKTSSTGSKTAPGAMAAAPVGGSCTELDNELSKITVQVNQLQAEKDAVDKAAETISAEANRFKDLLDLKNASSSTSTFSTSTSTSTSAQCTQELKICPNGSTVRRTGPNCSFTACSDTSTTSAFSLGLSPNTIHPGDTFTLSVNINSYSVQKYSVNVYQGSNLVGTLLNGATPDSSSRPAYVQKAFQISAGVPTGTYTVKISDDANSSIYQTATLTVIANQSSNVQTQITTTNSSNTISNGSSALTFTNPFTYSILPRNKNTKITWTATGNTNTPVNLYLKTSCVKNVPICTQFSPNNPTSNCITIKSSCKTSSNKTVSIGTVQASQGSFNWVVPYSVVDTVGLIYAEQNGQRVGSTGQFYISY
jgi:hypothetical protein